MKKAFAFILILALALAAFAGCSSPRPGSSDVSKATDDPGEVKVTEAPTEEPTAEPAEPTEAPTEEPASPNDEMLDIAWAIAEKICEVHGVTMEKENGTVKKSTGTGNYVATFSKTAENSDDVTEVVFVEFDGAAAEPTVIRCSFEHHSTVDWDKDKMTADHAPFDVMNKTFPYKTSEIEALGAALTADDVAEKVGAGKLAETFVKVDEDNYFFCTDAAPVKIEKVEGDDDFGRYNVTIAVRPVNDKLFQFGFAEMLGSLWNAVPSENEGEHSEFDYCYTLNCVMKVQKTDDGSGFNVSYGYTWESFEG